MPLCMLSSKTEALTAQKCTACIVVSVQGIPKPQFLLFFGESEPLKEQVLKVLLDARSLCARANSFVQLHLLSWKLRAVPFYHGGAIW